jgi:hypothetical protein
VSVLLLQLCIWLVVTLATGAGARDHERTNRAHDVCRFDGAFE